MLRPNDQRSNQLRGIQKLEPRWMLTADAVVESIAIESNIAEGAENHVIELHLDVSQDGESIVDEDRRFNVDVGERFDLELRYDDLRIPPFNDGAFQVAADILTSAAGVFRPVVSETQIMTLRNITTAVAGSVTMGAEGTTRTFNIPLFSSGGQSGLADDPITAMKSALEFILEIVPETINVDTRQVGSDVVFTAIFGEANALADIPNLTIDTAMLVGNGIESEVETIPAFVDNDPTLGVNPAAFYTSIDFASSTFRDLPIYKNLPEQSGRYQPTGSPALFDSVTGISSLFPFSADLPDIATGLSLVYTGTNIEVLSIRTEAISAGLGIELSAVVDDPNDGNAVIVFDSFFGTELTADQVLADNEDDPLIVGDDRPATVIADIRSGTAANVDFTITGDTVVFIDDSELVVTIDATETLRRPVTEITSMMLTGTSNSESLTFDFVGGAFDSIPSIIANGNGGDDTLSVVGPTALLDLTASSNLAISNFALLDLSEDVQPTVVIADLAAIADLVSGGEPLLLVGDKVDAGLPEDRLSLRDAEDWRLIEPDTTNDFRLVAEHQTTGQQIHASLLRPWQNFVSPSDVNNDGSVQATDALRIINALFRGEFTVADSDDLLAPDDIATWPGVYPDQNGDGKITALDALRVINEMARVGSESEPSAIAAIDWFWRQSTKPTNNKTESVENLSSRPLLIAKSTSIPWDFSWGDPAAERGFSARFDRLDQFHASNLRSTPVSELLIDVSRL